MIRIKNVTWCIHTCLSNTTPQSLSIEKSNATRADPTERDEKSPGFLTCIMAFRCSSNCANKLSTFSVFVASSRQTGKSIHRERFWKLKISQQKNSFKDDFWQFILCFWGLLKNLSLTTKTTTHNIQVWNCSRLLHPHPHSLDRLYPLMLWIYLATKSCR